MANIQTIRKFTHYCEKCKFQANRPAEWLIHIETQKHKRDGKVKSTICTICDTEFKTHWICKMHVLKLHAPKEERSKCKYYCDTCDVVFFSKLFLDKHCSGKVHLNLVKALNSLNDI
jgi:hypothetical protein